MQDDVEQAHKKRVSKDCKQVRKRLERIMSRWRLHREGSSGQVGFSLMRVVS